MSKLNYYEEKTDDALVEWLSVVSDVVANMPWVKPTDRQKVQDAAREYFQTQRVTLSPMKTEPHEPKYRLLNTRDVIEKDDEFLEDDGKTWTVLGTSSAVKYKFSSSLHKPMRRRIDT